MSGTRPQAVSKLDDDTGTGGGGGGLLPVDTQDATDVVSITSTATAGIDSFARTTRMATYQAEDQVSTIDIFEASADALGLYAAFGAEALVQPSDARVQQEFGTRYSNYEASGYYLSYSTADWAEFRISMNVTDNTNSPSAEIGLRQSATESYFKIESTAPEFIFNVAGNEGDIFFCSAPGVFTKLPIGTEDQVLSVTSGFPAWEDATGGGGGGDGQLARNVLIADTTVEAGISYVVSGELYLNGFDLIVHGEVHTL